MMTFKGKKVGVISKQTLLYSVAFFFLLKADYFSYMGILTTLYNYGFVITFCIIALYELTRMNHSSLKVLILLSILFPIMVGISYGVELTLPLFVPSLQAIGLTLLIGRGIRQNFMQCMKALALVLGIYVYLNLASIILVPEGLYGSDELYAGSYWLLGYKNVMIRFLLPAVFINAVYAVYETGRYTLRTYLLVIAAIATEILVDCKTGLVGILIMVFMMIVFSRDKLPRFFKLRNGIIVVVLISAALIGTNIIDAFSGVLSYLGETLSVYNRQLVWARAGQLIMESPFWGYGLRTNQGYRDLINLSLGWTYFSHPHNYIMYTLIQGGLIGFSFIVSVFAKAGKMCALDKDNFGAKMLIIMYIAFFVMGLTESLVGASLLLPLTLFAEGFTEDPIYYYKKGENEIEDFDYCS